MTERPIPTKPDLMWHLPSIADIDQAIRRLGSLDEAEVIGASAKLPPGTLTRALDDPSEARLTHEQRNAVGLALEARGIVFLSGGVIGGPPMKGRRASVS